MHPGAASLRAGVQDHEIQPCTAQVIARRQTRLATSDHDDIMMFGQWAHLQKHKTSNAITTTLEHVPIWWNHQHRKPMRKNKKIERPF